MVKGLLLLEDGSVQQIGDALTTPIAIINTMRVLIPQLEQQYLTSVLEGLTDEQKEHIKHTLFTVEE